MDALSSSNFGVAASTAKDPAAAYSAGMIEALKLKQAQDAYQRGKEDMLAQDWLKPAELRGKVLKLYQENAPINFERLKKMTGTAGSEASANVQNKFLNFSTDEFIKSHLKDPGKIEGYRPPNVMTPEAASEGARVLKGGQRSNPSAESQYPAEPLKLNLKQENQRSPQSEDVPYVYKSNAYSGLKLTPAQELQGLPPIANESQIVADEQNTPDEPIYLQPEQPQRQLMAGNPADVAQAFANIPISDIVGNEELKLAVSGMNQQAALEKAAMTSLLGAQKTQLTAAQQLELEIQKEQMKIAQISDENLRKQAEAQLKAQIEMLRLGVQAQRPSPTRGGSTQDPKWKQQADKLKAMEAEYAKFKSLSIGKQVMGKKQLIADFTNKFNSFTYPDLKTQAYNTFQELLVPGGAAAPSGFTPPSAVVPGTQKQKVPVAPAGQAPVRKVGDERVANGKTYVWNGKSWDPVIKSR